MLPKAHDWGQVSRILYVILSAAAYYRKQAQQIAYLISQNERILPETCRGQIQGLWRVSYVNLRDRYYFVNRTSWPLSNIPRHPRSIPCGAAAKIPPTQMRFNVEFMFLSIGILIQSRIRSRLNLLRRSRQRIFILAFFDLRLGTRAMCESSLVFYRYRLLLPITQANVLRSLFRYTIVLVVWRRRSIVYFGFYFHFRGEKAKAKAKR